MGIAAAYVMCYLVVRLRYTGTYSTAAVQLYNICYNAVFEMTTDSWGPLKILVTPPEKNLIFRHSNGHFRLLL